MARKAAAAAPGTRRPLATLPEIARHYGVSPKTVYDWIYRGVGPGALTFRVGGQRRARWEDIDRYDAEQAGGGQRAA